MSSSLSEELRAWIAAETQVAVFRSLMGVEVIALTHEAVSQELLEAVRRPLKDLYELSRDHEDTWEDEDDV